MKLALLFLLLLVSHAAAAGFGDIPASLALPAGTSVRRNAGNTAFEAFTPSVGGGVSLTATAPIVVTPSPITGTGVISVTVGSSGGVQAWDTDLDAWATKTAYAGTVTVTTGKTFNATGNLTYAGTDGSTLNIGSGGTLGTAAYTASTAYQATLTNSAGLRGALSDENGTGAALFNAATTPDFTTGFTIGAAAASGKILIGNGTNYVVSTPTWPTAAGTAGYTVRSDGTNFASYPQDMLNSSTATDSAFSAVDKVLFGSGVTIAAGDFKAKGQYHCVFDMVKSAGTGAIVITLRVGTLGTTSDAAIQTFTFGAGTSVADTARFEVWAVFRTVGSGTSAVVQGMCHGAHNLATTGMFNNADQWTVIGSPSPSSGFATNAATIIHVTFNGSTSFAGTNTMVQATLVQ